MTGQDQSVKLSRQDLRKLADFREMAEAHIERLGHAIRRRREELGWSRARLGREVNAHEKTVERWEKAQTAGAFDNIEQIATALELDPDGLLEEAMRKPAGKTPDLLGTLHGPAAAGLTDRLENIERMLIQILDHYGLERVEVDAAGQSDPTRPPPEADDGEQRETG